MDERTRSWLDTLTDEEHVIATRILMMPGGSMATAYIGVELHSLKEAVCGSRTPVKRHRDLTVGGGVGAAVAGMLYALAEFVRSLR